MDNNTKNGGRIMKKGFLTLVPAICFFFSGIILIIMEEDSLFVIGIACVLIGILYTSIFVRWFKKKKKEEKN